MALPPTVIGSLRLAPFLRHVMSLDDGLHSNFKGSATDLKVGETFCELKASREKFCTPTFCSMGVHLHMKNKL